MDIDPELHELTDKIIGAAIEMHRNLGSGFLESTYERALAIELRLRGIPFELQKPVALSYKGESIGDGRLDMLVDGQVVIELKAINGLTDAHRSQVLAYLKATDLRVGLLLNFHESVLKNGVRRIVN